MFVFYREEDGIFGITKTQHELSLVMEKKAISSSEMHTSLAPISHAIEVGNMVYISGKIGFTKEGKLAGGGLCGEVHQAMKNFESVLTAAGCTFDNGMFYYSF